MKRLSDISRPSSNVSERVNLRPSSSIGTRKAPDHMSKMGIHNIVSISEGGQMDDHIECLAADFTQITKGEIKTVISPISIKLKKEEETKGLCIGTLQSITDAMKKIGTNSVERPFVRFDRIQIMYCPLFHDSEDDTSKIIIELIDESRSAARERISGVEIPGSMMSLNELSMNFKVKRQDMSFIKLRFKAENIDVSERAYGAMFIAFFVQYDHDPSMYKKKDSLSLLLENMEVPKDINARSVFTQLGERVQSQIKSKREEYKRIGREENRRIEKLKNRIALDDVREKEENEYKSDNGSEDSEWEEVSTVSRPRMFVTEEKRKIEDTVHVVRKIRNVILDTGAPNHYIYNPLIKPTNIMENVLGFEKINYEVVEKTVMKLGETEVTLSNVLHVNEEISVDVISFDKLKEDGLVDKMTLNGEMGFLYLNGKVMWELYNDEKGMLCFRG